MKASRGSSKKGIARERLFELYAQSWNEVKRHPKLRVSPDIDDVFVCPLCFRYFTRECLAQDLLSLEHVPPKKLGGKDKDCTLTCTACNSETGSALEASLKSEIGVHDVLSRVPEASMDVEYRPLPGGENWWLPGTFRSTSEGFDIIGHPKRTHPKLIKAVSNDEFAQDVTEFSIRFRLDPLHSAVALLKIAYLYLFRVFGYGVLIPESMQSVRKQIQNPTDAILPRSWVVNWSFLERTPGVSLVFWPRDLRAFLVAFDLDTGRRRKRFGVVLPEPDDTELAVYNRLREGMSSRAVAVTLPADTVFVTDPALCFLCHSVWSQVYHRASALLDGNDIA